MRTQVSLIMELADYSLAERLHVCMAQPASARESGEGGPMSMRELLQVRGGESVNTC